MICMELFFHTVERKHKHHSVVVGDRLVNDEYQHAGVGGARPSGLGLIGNTSHNSLYGLVSSEDRGISPQYPPQLPPLPAGTVIFLL